MLGVVGSLVTCEEGMCVVVLVLGECVVQLGVVGSQSATCELGICELCWLLFMTIFTAGILT